nr:MAG TPA: hypothetical protein [Caudoviricetes sp.]DAV94214.1 MAG TPA: hypothetical protein [Caudoviricetes sp.]DAW34752.1 MAG TPA: hypothetical protein [Caudoviricetes sp.]DAW39503.1 MAG TPA: hypothetical protein [Bacteriophage sp.]
MERKRYCYSAGDRMSIKQSQTVNSEGLFSTSDPLEFLI